MHVCVLFLHWFRIWFLATVCLLKVFIFFLSHSVETGRMEGEIVGGRGAGFTT